MSKKIFTACLLACITASFVATGCAKKDDYSDTSGASSATTTNKPASANGAPSKPTANAAKTIAPPTQPAP